MHPVSTSIVNRFAAAFCYQRNGYSLRELEQLFVRYQVDVPAVDWSSPPTKASYFGQCVGSMMPETQRQFLYDLCDDPPLQQAGCRTKKSGLIFCASWSAATGCLHWALICRP